MALQDDDNFIVSDAAGTNYKINSTSLAAYINAQASGGGGGVSGGGGGAEAWGYIRSNSPGANGIRNVAAKFIKASPPTPLDSSFAWVGSAIEDMHDPDLVWFALKGAMDASGSGISGMAYKMMGVIPNDDTFPLSNFKATYYCVGGLFSTVVGDTIDDKGQTFSQHIESIIIDSGGFHYGCRPSQMGDFYPHLKNIRGTGSVPSVSNIPTLEYVGPELTIAGVEKGDYDFTNTAVNVETIVNWLGKLDLNTQDFKSRYFKTLRFDGGTAAAYEDFPAGVKERISELQDLGYTIVMNGTGDSTTINVTAGNVALIIETDDGRYVPVRASTSAAIFPPTGYVNVTQYSGLMAAKAALDAQNVTFKPQRLFDDIQLTLPPSLGTVHTVALGDAVSLDATILSNPENAAVTYKWYKWLVDTGDLEEIPNAEDPIIQTSSITEEKLGDYVCKVTLYHAATNRYLKYERSFSVKLADTPTPASVFIGSNAVDAVSIVAAGTGYTAGATDVATTGGSGSGLTVDYTTDGDGLLTVTVNNPGEGYTDGDNVTVNGGNNDATINCTVN